jgi:hypothetical protein
MIILVHVSIYSLIVKDIILLYTSVKVRNFELYHLRTRGLINMYEIQ